MVARAFATPIVDDGEMLVGPWRTPQQMLVAQVYDGRVSIHDNAMAQKAGFRAATIEGPTHFPPVRSAVRALVGRRVVRDRVHVRAPRLPPKG